MPNRILFFALALVTTLSCAPFRLASYSLSPDDPQFGAREEIRIDGLAAPVTVSVRADGRYRIEAATDHDLYLVEGYLQARDRMFQLDFLRHMARGRISEIVGDVSMGAMSSIETDTLNRFLGFSNDADRFVSGLEPGERADMEAFATGVNAWLATGHLTLEHRLLGLEPAPWKAADSLAIFRLVMFGLTHNYSRELRRLALACGAGVEGMERIWPSRIEFPNAYILPAENFDAKTYAEAQGVVPEMRAALPGLCPPGNTQAAQRQTESAYYNPLSLFSSGIQASNSWVIAGSKTATGKPILANDPHLPHLNPPILWGVEQVTPGKHLTGFALVGVHRVTIGHNDHVAWGVTINNVDLQDLVVEKPAAINGRADRGYEIDGKTYAFGYRSERFNVKGGAPVVRRARFTQHGVVLNDIDPLARNLVPLTSLKTVAIEKPGDATAFRNAATATTAMEFAAAILPFDTACLNWVFADTSGNIGYASPCRVPIRAGYSGTFPIPGWISAYGWRGFVPKDQMPRSLNPAQGWIATANNQVIPKNRFASTYNNDASPPNRWAQIAAQLGPGSALTVTASAALQMDTGLSYWAALRPHVQTALCATAEADEEVAEAAKLLCDWDGDARSDSAAATVFMLWTHAVMDAAFADELPGGAQGAAWKYALTVPHIETNIDWMWTRAATDTVWNDARTPLNESRDDIWRAALHEAVAFGDDHFDGAPSEWKWGSVRPFVLKHFFGGKGGVVGSVFNAPSLPGTGAPETVFKNQFVRSDRENMVAVAGPAIRFVADLSDLNQSQFAFAGGESGWPKNPHYGDMLSDWMNGVMHPLTPAEPPVSVIIFVP